MGNLIGQPMVTYTLFQIVEESLEIDKYGDLNYKRTKIKAAGNAAFIFVKISTVIYLRINNYFICSILAPFSY